MWQCSWSIPPNFFNNIPLLIIKLPISSVAVQRTEAYWKFILLSNFEIVQLAFIWDTVKSISCVFCMTLFLLIAEVLKRTVCSGIFIAWNVTFMGLIPVLMLGFHCRNEHIKRYNCGFLALTKPFDDLTMEEYYMLEMTRLRTFLVSVNQIILI